MSEQYFLVRKLGLGKDSTLLVRLRIKGHQGHSDVTVSRSHAHLRRSHTMHLTTFDKLSNKRRIIVVTAALCVLSAVR